MDIAAIRQASSFAENRPFAHSLSSEKQDVTLAGRDFGKTRAQHTLGMIDGGALRARD